MKIKISNGSVVQENKIVKTDILIENGIIKSVGKNKSSAADKVIDAAGKYILPGFIDIHSNGMGGYDTTNGKYDTAKDKFIATKKEYNSALEKALKTYLAHGTTLVGLTTLEAPLPKLKKVLGYVGDYKNSGNPLADVIYGIYMEGTFMKDPNFKGAHNPKYFMTPSIKLFNEFQKAAKGTVKIVNVVPEWGKRATKLIEYMRNNGVIAAMGHTGANGNETNDAIKSGASIGVHLFNGPSLSSYKPFDGGGAVEAFIKSDDVFVEIIGDGYHVDSSYLLDVIKRKGIERSVIITDSMFTVDTKGVKEFTVTGIKCKTGEGGKYLMLVESKKKLALAGSSLTMDRAFENLLNWYTTPQAGVWNRLHEPLKAEQAILNSSKLCSATPAKAVKVYESTESQPGTGSIEKGKKANLVIADIAQKSGRYKVKLEKVLLNGEDYKTL